MQTEIQVTTNPPDLIDRMTKYPKVLDRELKRDSNESLLHIQGSVPAYPKAPPNVRTKRTGTLGRTLGSSVGGIAIGTPDIRIVKKLGTGRYIAEFGTRLHYAPRVIGEGTQKPPWVRYWWNMRTVAKRSTQGILRIHQSTANRMAAYLEGKRKL